MPKPKRWPNYALDALEEIRQQFRETQRLTRQAQEAVLEGKQLEAIVLLGDIRDRASQGVSLTVQAYTGDYEGGDWIDLITEESPAGTGLGRGI
jgi:hypothetical protein